MYHYITHITDFVPIFFIFNLFQRIFRGKEGLRVESKAKSEKIIFIQESIEEESEYNLKVFKKLTVVDSNIDKDLDQQMVM